MTDRWHDYITEGVDRAGNRVVAAHDAWKYLEPMLDLIRRRLPAGARILELGCGAGLHAVLLSAWGYRVTALDNDPRIVELARETASMFDQKVDVVAGDAQSLPSHLSGYDLVFSLGLMEHFDRDVSVRMLRDQGKIADRVLVEIPTRYTKYAAPITDERIYRLAGLKQMFASAGLATDDALVYTNVPTRLSRALGTLLPPPAWTWVQRTFSYGLTMAVIGHVRS